jgi:hypothetical protein
MNIKLSKIKNYNIKILLLLIIIGIFFCYKNSYLLSGDTYGIINSFLGIVHHNQYMPSRAPGSIVTEIIIGFLAYFFGSFPLNLIIYFLNITGVIFFFLFLNDKKIYSGNKINDQLILFLLLCLSNWVIFRNSTLLEDYTIPFFFFTLGSFFLKKKQYELSIIALALSIGARLNFYIFILILLFFFKEKNHEISLEKRIILILSVTFIGGLFYLPIWFMNGFKLNWIIGDDLLYNHKLWWPVYTDQGLKGLLSRFFYKIFFIIGFIQFFIILIYCLLKKINILNIKGIKLILFLILSNLLIFIYLPYELGYLWIYIILFYYIISVKLNKFFIYLLVIINLTSWFFNFNFISIKYKEMNMCTSKYAIGAEFKPNLSKGFIFTLEEEKKMIECFDFNLELKDKLLKGNALR